MGCGPYEAFQSCRGVVGRAESPVTGSRQWRVVSRADVCGALYGRWWWHSQVAAPNRPVQAISRVGLLGVWVVMDWVIEWTSYTFGGRSNCQYNCRGHASRVLLVRVSAWVRFRARARKWARFWAWTQV